MTFGSSCCLLFYPDTLEVFRTSSVNGLLANIVAKFFLEQLLRKICVVSPDVSWGAGTVLLLVLPDVLSGGEFASVTTWLTSAVLFVILGSLLKCLVMTAADLLLVM